MPAYFEFKQSTEVGMRVAIHGGVSHPGLYEIPIQSELMDVLALAGGISLGSRLRENSERLTLAVYRAAKRRESHCTLSK